MAVKIVHIKDAVWRAQRLQHIDQRASNISFPYLKWYIRVVW